MAKKKDKTRPPHKQDGDGQIVVNDVGKLLLKGKRKNKATPVPDMTIESNVEMKNLTRFAVAEVTGVLLTFTVNGTPQPVDKITHFGIEFGREEQLTGIIGSKRDNIVLRTHRTMAQVDPDDPKLQFEYLLAGSGQMTKVTVEGKEVPLGPVVITFK